MEQFTFLFLGVSALIIGSILGYLARQSIAKRDYDTIEAKIQRRAQKAKEEVDTLLKEAREKSGQILDSGKKEIDNRREELLKTEELVFKRENILNEKITDYERKEIDLNQKVEKLKTVKESLEGLQKEAQGKLEKISELSKEEAKKELLDNVEKESQQEVLERMRKLERAGEESFEKRAKELLTLAIQRCALSQAQEITTTTLTLPSDEIKGRIIGKEGRNIRVFEKLTGVEVILDETPETVVISSFDPVRRQVAKLALEKLIKDGRIQPARVEETVAWAQGEINSQMKEAGEQAVFDVGILGLDPKLIQLLGRLRFRTSYGQNVLLHSIEVAHLAALLASELGLNPKVVKKAGLFHDIGKALDHQVEGSHVDIGIKVLQRFGIEKEVIDAMKAHHEEYPYENLEAILVKTADQISGARPGARKDTVENYLRRLGELESIANSFTGVEKSYAIQAGREIRVFVKPEEIDDLSAKKLARDMAKRIEEELRYPGEIKVTVIRESRVIEYAR
ncbi:MAG: ribonuclease Y [Patescibacteria group bacterium]